VAQKKSRQTFEKLKREQAVKEKRARKQERKEAARLAKAIEAEGEAGAAPEEQEPTDSPD
jgi:hypothetical protein